MSLSVARLRVSNLNSLVALERLLATRSVRRAAEACGVTQSAMSHTLAQLRVELDDPLLVRDGNGMVLTPGAESLARPLAEALAALEAALSGAAPFDPATSRTTFAIAASDAVALHVLAPFVGLCAREAPNVVANVVAYDRATVEDELMSGTIDLAIGPPAARDASWLEQRTLYSSEFVVAIRRAHPALRRPWSLDTYCALGHLVVGFGPMAPTAVDRALERQGRARRVSARVPYFVAAPVLLAASDLVLTAPRVAVEPLARGLELRLLTPPIDLPTTRISLFFHRRLKSSPAHRWLRSAVARAVAAVPAHPRSGRRATL